MESGPDPRVDGAAPAQTQRAARLGMSSVDGRYFVEKDSYKKSPLSWIIKVKAIIKHKFILIFHY
jgi:hypothetical protein